MLLKLVKNTNFIAHVTVLLSVIKIKITIKTTFFVKTCYGFFFFLV